MTVRADLTKLVDETIDEREVIRLSRELIRIPSTTTHEERISKFILQKLEGWGLSPKSVPTKGYGPSVVCEIGNRKAPSVVFNGHMDTVEVMSGWKHDPFGAKVEKGMLYGLGALDMKCGLAAMMSAFRVLAEAGVPQSSRLMFQAVSGEEDTSAGTRALLSKGFFRRARAVIVGEGFGGVRAITNGRRGGSYFDIEVIGKAAHGANPEAGINAVSDAASIVCALDKMTMREARGLSADDFLPLSESQTVLRISGGSQTLTVPGRCFLKVMRCTIPGGGDPEREIRDQIGRLNLRSKVKIELETGPGDMFNPYITDPDSRLVKAASRWVTRLTGEKPRYVIGRSEADDNLIAHHLEVPVICFGPGESGVLARYHQPEEAVSIDQLGIATKVYAGTALELMYE